MTKVVLPKLNQTGANLWSSVQANDEALQTVVNGEISNENIAAGASIARSKLEGGAQGVAGQWYTPKIIATEQTRESATLGAMSTADEITGVVVPENGFVRVGYTAAWKSSVSGAGRAALVIDSGVVFGIGGEIETPSIGTTFHLLGTTPQNGEGGGKRPLGSSFETGSNGTVAMSFLELSGVATGTHTVAIWFRATSGNVTVKERKLWVEVHGF